MTTAQKAALSILSNTPRRIRLVAPQFCKRSSNYLTERTYDSLIRLGLVVEVERLGACSPGNSTEVSARLA